MPYIRASPFVWGITGHPLTKIAYTSPAGWEEQFEYLDSLRIGAYRVDVVVDTLDDIAYSASAPFTTLLDLADRHHIAILPVLTQWPDTAHPATPEQNYHAGYRIGFVLAARYGSRITHIEAGNELDALSMFRWAEGSDLAQYDDRVLRLTTAFLRGMARGIRAGAPQAKIIINASGWRHHGFFDALTRDSVEYDVLGYHWYSNSGDIDAPIEGGPSVLAHLSRFKKDIWITESGRQYGSYQEAPPLDHAYWIRKYLRDFYRVENVKAFFVYELYDERAIQDNGEAFHGLLECTQDAIACLGAKTRKPSFDAFRYGIEEQGHGYEDYIFALFERLGGSPPDAAKLGYWTTQLQATRNSTTFLERFMPLESTAPFVRDAFTRVLGHQGDAATVAYWADRMRNGLRRRGLIAELCASDEFWRLSGATNQGFINRLYRVLLPGSVDPDRPADFPDEFFTPLLRRRAAESVLDSRVFRLQFIDAQYRALLARSADATERAATLGRMESGAVDLDGVIVELVLSREFWSAAIRAGYARRR